MSDQHTQANLQRWLNRARETLEAYDDRRKNAEYWMRSATKEINRIKRQAHEAGVEVK